jgi:hypothetical protein
VGHQIRVRADLTQDVHEHGGGVWRDRAEDRQQLHRDIDQWLKRPGRRDHPLQDGDARSRDRIRLAERGDQMLDQLDHLAGRPLQRLPREVEEQQRLPQPEEIATEER